jgi:hypothetical protein
MLHLRKVIIFLYIIRNSILAGQGFWNILGRKYLRTIMMKAKIFKPSRNAMQSGRAKTQDWVLEFPRGAKLEPESLMGWTQSGDTLNQVRLKFKTLDEAKAYAQKQGLEFTVAQEAVRKPKPRNYGDNFKYIPYEGA